MRFVDPPTIAHYIDLLKAGFRFCAACGEVKIGAMDPAWKDICSECWEAGKRDTERLYCKDCGTPLEANRIATAKKHKGVCRRCCWCSKIGKHVNHCARCNVAHPNTWHEIRVPTFA